MLPLVDAARTGIHYEMMPQSGTEMTFKTRYVSTNGYASHEPVSTEWGRKQVEVLSSRRAYSSLIIQGLPLLIKFKQ